MVFPHLEIRHVIYLLAALTLTIPQWVSAEVANGDTRKVQQKTSSPQPHYPDVWWRPYPYPENIGDDINVYDLGDGDRRILFSWSEIPSDPTGMGVSFQEFFSGREWIVTHEDIDELIRKTGLTPHFDKNIQEIEFSDRTFIEFYRGRYEIIRQVLDDKDNSLDDCFLGTRIHKYDVDNNVVWKRVLLRLRKTPRKKDFRYAARCIDEYEEIPPHLAMVEGWGVGVKENHILGDDTFLARLGGFGAEFAGYRAVVRFDSNMQSPFMKTMDDLFFVEEQDLEPIFDEAYARMRTNEPGFHVFQFIDNEIAEYLMELKSQR